MREAPQRIAKSSPAPPQPEEKNVPALYRWLTISLLVVLSAGSWLLMRVRTPSSMKPAAALESLKSGKRVNGTDLCRAVVTKDLRGAFRELDCLITFRQALPVKGKALNGLLLRKLRTLHRRLRNESVDWRTVARWKLLYQLGTRMYAFQNKWAEHAAIPVYEVNGHHMSMPFWTKEALRRDVGPLFHFDTHNDMRAVPSPHDVRDAVQKLRHNRELRTAWHTIAHAVYDCAMPVAGGVLAGAYNRVIWGKPSWNGYPDFVNRNFFFGYPKKGVALGIVPDKLSAAEKKKLSKRLKKLSSKRSHFRLYYDDTMDPFAKKSPMPDAEAWIKIQKQQRPTHKKFKMQTKFLLTILTTDETIDANGKGKGAKMFQNLLKAIPKGPYTLDLDLDYFASVDSADEFKRTAGSDPHWDLDKFKKRRKLLRQRLQNFRNLLVALRERGRIPSLITIADSTYLTFALDARAEGQSEYTPVEHTAFLRMQVRKMFVSLFGDKVIGRGKHVPWRVAKNASIPSLGPKVPVRPRAVKGQLNSKNTTSRDNVAKSKARQAQPATLPRRADKNPPLH